MTGPLRDPGPDARRAVDDLGAGVVPDGELPLPDPAATPEAAGGQPEPTVEPLPDAPIELIDDWSMDQLHRRASEVGLENRWELSREQLIEALREP